MFFFAVAHLRGPAGPACRTLWCSLPSGSWFRKQPRAPAYNRPDPRHPSGPTSHCDGSVENPDRTLLNTCQAVLYFSQYKWKTPRVIYSNWNKHVFSPSSEGLFAPSTCGSVYCPAVRSHIQLFVHMFYLPRTPEMVNYRLKLAPLHHASLKLKRLASDLFWQPQPQTHMRDFCLQLHVSL